MIDLKEKLIPRVVQFGPPRTGSTLVWNAMRFMLPGRVIPKRHDLHYFIRRPFYGTQIVCTMRNPLDAIASSIRRYGFEPTVNVVEGQVREFSRHGMNELPGLMKRKNCLILKYEMFYRDFGYLFDQLEGVLKVNADVAIREQFDFEFSARRVKEKSDQLGGFENFSVEDHIHGGHVSERFGEPGGHCGFFNKESARLIREAFAWHFEAFDYE